MVDKHTKLNWCVSAGFLVAINNILGWFGIGLPFKIFKVSSLRPKNLDLRLGHDADGKKVPNIFSQMVVNGDESHGIESVKNHLQQI